MTDELDDVVIVGGGIAGAALAAVLARSGVTVRVLERQVRYRDRVRGEVLSCWGVRELRALQLEDCFLSAGGSYVSRAVSYDETSDPRQAEEAAALLDKMVPGVPGTMTVGHPDACHALAEAASTAGAVFVHGVEQVQVTGGPIPSVSYSVEGVEYHVRARVVVGADGRTSTVRKQLDFELHQTMPRTMISGLLVDGATSWPEGQLGEGTERDLHYYVLPRPGGRARLYLLYDLSDKRRFAGSDRTDKFLQAFRFECMPRSIDLTSASPAGNCASYPLNDSWVENPCRENVVLIGDATGWNDPIIGQGLSLALRDARIVAESLMTHRFWTGDIFEEYARERRERMRRLRVTARIKTSLVATFNEAGLSRRRTYNAVWRDDAAMAGPQLAPLVGPHNADPVMFTDAAVQKILRLA